MPKGTNQKLKLLFLMQILQERTDDNHGLTMQEIIDALQACDVTAERKSIYTDIELLNQWGLDIVMEGTGRNTCYKMAGRHFELAELKLLVDAIQSSKFITEKKSNELIKKLENQVSKYDAKLLQRQVYVTGRIKTINESIYYNVDTIHSAITNNCKIKFQYFQWNIKKEMELKRNGEVYEISPWALTWDDENYYMVGYDSKQGIIKHYRVDKMIKISCIDDKREGAEVFDSFDITAYSKKNFGMFAGEEEHVKLLMDNSLVGVVIDRFGKDVRLIPADDNHFTVTVNVAVSKQFFGWVFALGNGAKILGPEKIVEDYKARVKEILDNYN